MNTFAQNFAEESNMSYTENGAVCLKSTMNANLDFFSMAGGMRGDPRIEELYAKALNEDLPLAVKNLFFLRDVRNGMGERSSFVRCFKLLLNEIDDEEVVESLFKEIGEYGRWSDLFSIMHDAKPEWFDVACKVVKEQIKEDWDLMEQGKSVSLLAKWFPLANNRHNPEAIRHARRISEACCGSDRNARKLIVPLRKYINVVEQKISENRWDEVEYSKLPSGAGLKYRQAFWKHDGERYGAFIENVSKGEEKINSGTLMPYDLVRKECEQNSRDAVIEELWKALPDWTNDSSSLVVADVSGSMYGTYCWRSVADVSSKPAPIFVSTSLAMYFAEKSKGPFKDCVITFSQHPECLKLNPEDSLFERFMKMERHGGLNTNIEKMFKLYISLAQDSKPEDCPKNLVIISDMEFDEIENPEEWWYSNSQEEAKKKLAARKKTLFSKIDLLFKNTNVERPTLVFWNVNSRQANVPVSRDEYGTILVSGFSPTIFQYIVGGDINPMKFMLKTLSNYDCILERAGIGNA
jgi:hypothetical protein